MTETAATLADSVTLDATAAGEQAAESEAEPNFAEVLGHVTRLMLLSPDHRDQPLSELEQRVIPALLLRQFCLFRKDGEPQVRGWMDVDV